MKIEDFVPVGEIVVANLTRDLSHFNAKYKNIDGNYVEDFKLQLGKASAMESVFSVTEEQKMLTIELYDECGDFLDKLMFMKSYAKEVGLNFNIISTIAKLFRNRNIEGAVKSCRDAFEYYSNNVAKLNTGNMPEGFLDNLVKKLQIIEMLNNKHNSFVLGKKEKTANNRAVYDKLYSYISDVCAAGKLIFKENPVKRNEYTLSRIVQVLQSSHKKKNEE
ncbi:MAG: hypothetical protein LBV41_13970 [Cytophagaceae bacterium]|jgi:hypothetical protein|nr:hypothetical protein [Cytophagaceae bacterium]